MWDQDRPHLTHGIVNSLLPQRASSRYALIALFIYALGAGVIGWLVHGIRFDDPFITYRYAAHLAHGQGFRFNVGETTLITTAPLYALILAAMSMFGLQPEQISVWIGIASLALAAWALLLLGERRGQTIGGFVAGLLLLLCPLAWLTLGFETPLFIAVALFTYLAVDSHRPVWAGIGAGIALGLRGDGAIVLAVALLFAFDWETFRRALRTGMPIKAWFACSVNALRILLIAVLVYLPLAVWLMVQFGSPIPTTLQTKSAQAISGLTGFYPYTSFLQGGWMLVQALVMQSPLLIALLPLCLIGIVAVIWKRHADFHFPIVWGVAHLVGYTLLSVSPYVWYYAPALPGLLNLSTEGIRVLSKAGRSRLRPVTVFAGLTGLLVIGSIAADLPIISVVHGATPPPPTDLRAKLLPETKVDIYKRVGTWMHDHTPPTATFGVTELGVMGYYSDRRMIDFLGLTQPQYLAAIRHDDYLQALIREQPDYVALSNVNALYDVDPQRSAWFTALYTPVVSFSDERFWGSPMVVWRRLGAPVSTNIVLDDTPHDLGDGWQIMAVRANSSVITPGSPLFTQLLLRAGQADGTRTLRVQAVLIQGGDGLPVTSRLIHTDLWKNGEQDWVDFPIVPQQNPPPGGYVIQANWLGSGRQVQTGYLKVGLGVHEPADATFAPLSDGVKVQVLSQPITACIGGQMPVTVTWRGGTSGLMPYTAFVQLRSGETVISSADAPPRQGTYPTPVWSVGEVIPDVHVLMIPADVAPGAYDLVVGLYLPKGNKRLAVDASAFRTPDGGVRIAVIQARSCQ